MIGDFNSRITGRLDHEQHILGPHVYGKGSEHVELLCPKTRENRELLLEFCDNLDLKISNTFFKKNDDKQISYRDPTAVHGPPWPKERFYQLDLLLTQEKWKNSVKNVETDTKCNLYTDHYPLICTIQTKLAKTLQRQIKLRFTNSCEDDIKELNTYFTSKLDPQNLTHGHFTETLYDAAKNTLPQKNKEIKQSYITDQTWNLIKERQQIWHKQKQGNLQEINKEIKKACRRDRTNAILAQIENTTLNSPNWKSIKDLKHIYTPNFTKLKNVKGERSKTSQRAETVADYLEQKHWACNNDAPFINDRNPIHKENIHFDEGDYSLEEMNYCINRTCNKKAPGPDGIQNELIKNLDQTNREHLLKLFNKWNKEKSIDKNTSTALVVTIFKKGNTQDNANYRPISLLNTILKIYCAMIKIRIEKQIDRFINDTQYGFRKGKSCSQALHVVRRIQDFGECTNENVIMVFLDWEKAFDKIIHEKLLQALKRIGISEHFLLIIADLYKEPKFKVKYEDQISDIKNQKTGIRQGCTLSPYLFLILMTVLLHDVKTNVPKWALNNNIPGLLNPEVLFADDTTLVATNTKAIHRILHEIETQSSYYGLSLNHKKCAYFAINRNNRIFFKNGEEVQKTTHQTYLGALLTSNVEIKEEISARISKANQVFHRLKTFWKNSNCSIRWKIQVYDAIIKAITLYGLETVHITKAQIDRLHAMHTKGLRNILKLKHTYIDRSSTYERIWTMANDKIKTGKHTNAQVFSFESTLKQRRIKFLGHILRAANNDPMRAITFQPNTAKPAIVHKRRVGGPRKNWTWETLKMAWEAIFPLTPFDKSDTQLQTIMQEALNRNI